MAKDSLEWPKPNEVMRQVTMTVIGPSLPYALASLGAWRTWAFKACLRGWEVTHMPAQTSCAFCMVVCFPKLQSHGAPDLDTVNMENRARRDRYAAVLPKPLSRVITCAVIPITWVTHNFWAAQHKRVSRFLIGENCTFMQVAPSTWSPGFGIPHAWLYGSLWSSSMRIFFSHTTSISHPMSHTRVRLLHCMPLKGVPLGLKSLIY